MLYNSLCRRSIVVPSTLVTAPYAVRMAGRLTLSAGTPTVEVVNLMAAYCDDPNPSSLGTLTLGWQLAFGIPAGLHDGGIAPCLPASVFLYVKVPCRQFPPVLRRPVREHGRAQPPLQPVRQVSAQEGSTYPLIVNTFNWALPSNRVGGGWPLVASSLGPFAQQFAATDYHPAWGVVIVGGQVQDHFDFAGQN